MDAKKKQRVELRGVTLFDFAVIVPILALSLFLLFRPAGEAESTAASEAQAVVYRDGQPAGRFALDQGRQIQTMQGAITLEIMDHSIRIAQSDCPRGICVHQGWIRHAGETIVCIPHKMIIEIQAAGGPIVDAVVY